MKQRLNKQLLNRSSLKQQAVRIAVLMGGDSAESEISLQGGRAVLTALQSKGFNATAIDVKDKGIKQLCEKAYDCAFIMLHGRGGEDGLMQGLLEMMQIPYTGSGVLASALAMDKLRTKQIWQAAGLPTPVYQQIKTEQDCALALQTVGLPMIIKPVLEGSSIGMSKVEAEDELMPAWEKARRCGGAVIAEEWIEGKEYTAAILEEQVLPVIRLQTPRKFYDYEAKYAASDTQYICPCGLNQADEQLVAELVKKAFFAVGASGWGRVDFMIDNEDQPWLIEVNTVPGMTSHSLVPMAAAQAGLSFDELVVEILNTAAEGCEQ